MIYDVIVVGAGPCGLAVAARLRENTPSALFTDAEHARYWRRHSRQVHTLEREARESRKPGRHSRGTQQINGHAQNQHQRDLSDIDDDANQRHHDPSIQSAGQCCSPSMLVLDASSEHWLSTWHSRFETLNIAHLRSPLFFHCDPRDRDGLLEYSHTQARTGELAEINNVVGREVSKHQKKKGKKRDQIDYYTPSTSIFRDYCDCLINRYNLSKLVRNATVTSIKYGTTSISTEGNALFTLSTATNQVFLARTVVVAVGPGKRPSIPPDYKFLGSGSASHIFDESSQSPLIPADTLSRKETGHPRVPTTIAIIGGGLTSAQIVSLLLTQHGIDKVHLILRSKLKIKHFDVDLEWVSKLRNANMAAFWSADTDAERFEMLRHARGGGSIPPKWAKLLHNFEKEGRLQCWEDTVVVGGTWDDLEKTWVLDLNMSCTQQVRNPSHETLDSAKGVLPTRSEIVTGINHVICATGLAPSIKNVDFLSEISNEYPVSSIGGLAQINDDLRWHPEVPLFLTGALAGLRLGPGAGNLAGARLGAERIAWGVEKALGRDTRSNAVNVRDDGTPILRKPSEADSAYWSGTSSDATDELLDDDEREHGDWAPHHAYSAVDRSEFTGGFSNQFEALAI